MYFSLEMSSATTMDRLLSKRLEIPYSDIINPKDPGAFEDVLSMIDAEREQLSTNIRFRFSEDPSISLNDLKKHIRKFQTDMGQNYCIVVLDLLSMITDFTKVANGMNFAQGIEVAVNKLSAISKEMGVHVVGVLQLNRAQETDVKCNDLKDLERFRPNRAQIKNAGAWIERSRYVLTTFRERMYAELYLDPSVYENLVDVMEVQLVKANSAKIGKTVKALFVPEYFTCEAMPEYQSIAP